MSKNKTKRGRGAPEKPMNLPRGKFTINDVVQLNPQLKCRLSVYNKVKKLIAAKIVRPTGLVIVQGVGKPLDEFESMANYRRNVKRRQQSKEKAKLAKLEPVDLTPKPEPEASPESATEPVAA